MKNGLEIRKPSRRRLTYNAVKDNENTIPPPKKSSSEDIGRDESRDGMEVGLIRFGDQ